MEINRQEVLIGVIYFFYLAGLSCLMPYLPVFMRHKGLGEGQIGLVRGMEAMALMVFTPLWGYIATKTPYHKVVLLVTMVVATLFTISILFVPANLSASTCFSSDSCAPTNSSTTNSFPVGTFLPADIFTNTNDQHFLCNISPLASTSASHIDWCTTSSQLCRTTFNRHHHPSIVLATDRQLQPPEICIWSNVRMELSCNEVYVVEDILRESRCHICCLNEDEATPPSCCNSTTVSGIDSSSSVVTNREDRLDILLSPWNNWVSFLLIAVLLMSSSFFRCAIFPILDYTSMELLERSRARYNKERLWGSVGWGVFALLSGVVVDVFPFENFATCFYMSLSLTAVAVVGVGCLRFPVQDVVHHANGLARILCKPEILVFFSLALVMGFSFGILGTYLLLYLEDLGGPYSLMGLTMTLSCLAEVPFLYLSGTMMQVIGHHGIILLALVCYTVRFTAYSLIRVSWLVLPFELLHGVTYGASWAGCSFFANNIAPPGLPNKLLKIFTAIYMGLGKGLGAFVGGFVYQYLGAKFLFRFSALFSILSAVAYAVAVIVIRKTGADYKQFVDTLDDADRSSSTVPMESRHHSTDIDDTPRPPTRSSSIQSRKQSMLLPLQDIYQPDILPSDIDQECLLSSEVTPPDLRVMRLEFQPPPDWLLAGRSRAESQQGKRDLEVRMDAIGSEDSSGKKRKGATHTSLV